MAEKVFFNWLLGDHLGSTSMVANASGVVVGEARYSAFGKIWYDSGTMTTDYLYTGQRQEAEIGLYYYVARWYDPAIGRFIQADSVVPNPGSAIGYDRYAYGFNNSLVYTDPSGYAPIIHDCEFYGSCADTGTGEYPASMKQYFLNQIYGVQLTGGGQWSDSEINTIYDAVSETNLMFNQFESNFIVANGNEGLSIIKSWESNGLWAQTATDGSGITFFFDGSIHFTVGLIIHELGHVFDFRHNINNIYYGGIGTEDWINWNNQNPGWIGYPTGFIEADYSQPGSGENLYYFGMHEPSPQEEFADMFLMLVMDYQVTSLQGAGYSEIVAYKFRLEFMETGMSYWINNQPSPYKGQ